jgi:hypothetical protein
VVQRLCEALGSIPSTGKKKKKKERKKRKQRVPGKNIDQVLILVFLKQDLLEPVALEVEEEGEGEKDFSYPFIVYLEQ